MKHYIHVRIDEATLNSLNAIFAHHKNASLRNMSEYIRAVLLQHIETQRRAGIGLRRVPQ